jgi:hypothetical protein
MNYKISELQARSNLSSKQSVYMIGMKALQILPITHGEIFSEPLDKLEKLNEFIKNNPRAKVWEFPKDTESITSLPTGPGGVTTRPKPRWGKD